MEVPDVDVYVSDDVTLTDEQALLLQKQESRLVSDYTADKIEKESNKFWDKFYKRNQAKFFKDRHWTVREFEELVSVNGEGIVEKKVLLEVGCGTGNLIFPLIEVDPTLFVYACDFSQRAIDFVKSHPLYNGKNITAFVTDITDNFILDLIPKDNVSIATLVFVLSAINPVNYDTVLNNLFLLLKPGGIVLFRDYGIYDMAQLRFKPGHKISDNFYMRQDGTRSYFFSLEVVQHMFKKAGFEEISVSYVNRRTVNKKENIDVPRRFVQARYRKPLMRRHLIEWSGSRAFYYRLVNGLKAHTVQTTKGNNSQRVLIVYLFCTSLLDHNFLRNQIWLD